jgi:hypothetical protein
MFAFFFCCSTVGRQPSTDYKYDFDSVSGKVSYLFLSEACNKFNAGTFQGGDDENEFELLWS